MSKNLILFSLGPVQSFISQARKTQDLYAGSQLLSDLMKAAVDVVGKSNVIFPNTSGESLPNRFVAWVPQNETGLQAFGEKVESAVRTKWSEISNAPDTLKGVKKPKGFNEQINTHLEVFWAIETNVTDYKTAIGHLEKNLAAVKNVRRFCQYKYSDAQIGEQGRKCSLDGQRNVKFYRKTQNGSDKSLYSSSEMFDSLNFGDSRLPISVLQPGEGLSAVSFVKRRYEAKAIGEFKSTADIALLDALIFLKNYTAGAILLNEFRTQIFSDFNAQLLYEDNLNQRYLDKQGINFKNGYSLEDAQAKRKGLEEIARIEGNMPFSKYFAVLTFDGDDMGKWLSGKLLKQGQDLKSFHEKMAECLGDFAGDAWNLLNGGPGQTAYAGGDDFLGFVNPNYLLKTLLNLRKMFSVKVDKQLSSFKDKELTFSAGICIAHYKEPLSLVLQNARNMLEKAKDKDKSKKNAFGISVLKGSGENHETIWEFGKQEINVTHIGTLVKKMVEETFSNSFIKALRLEFDRLPHPDGKMLDPVLEKSFETELTRLLNRACSIRGDEELKRAEVKSLKDALWGLYDGDVNNFFQMLHIADFLHRTVNKASFTKPEPITA